MWMCRSYLTLDIDLSAVVTVATVWSRAWLCSGVNLI